MVSYLTPQEARRKENERITMMEGIQLYKRQKEIDRLKVMKEQREVRELLENYWPWGRPGGGAPNSRNVGLRNVNLEEMYANEELLKAKRQAGTFQFGRPGGGAPHISRTGHKQVGFKEDPALRFQFGEDLRRTVDNTLRYRSRREDQELYKQQLDSMVEEKRQAREYELKKKLDFERKMCLRSPPWGKAGPGGKVWRQPKNLGVNFLKSMGWTNDATIRNLQNERSQHHNHVHQQHQHHHHHHHHAGGENDRGSVVTRSDHSSISRPSGGHQNVKRNEKFIPAPSRNSAGVELVPLITHRRPPVKVPLGSTDVTRGDAMPNRMNISEPKYLRDLTDQVQDKNRKIKDLRKEEVQSCKKHFETWGGFWGRPGHGAPRSANQKGRLMSLLYPQMRTMPVH